MINIALIGLGHIATHTIEALNILKVFNLKYAADINMTKKTKLPSNVKFYLDYKQMFNENDDIDAVAIAVPVEFHLEIVKNLVNKVKYILLEKPAANSIDELNELWSIINISDSKIIFALHARFAKELLWFKDQYSKTLKNELGEIQSFSSNFFDPYIQDGIATPICKNLVGSWKDSAVNALSVISDLIDIKNIWIENIYFTHLPKIHGHEIQSNANCFFKTKGGKTGFGNINTNWLLHQNHKSTTLTFDNNGAIVTLNHSTQQVFLKNKKHENNILCDFSETNHRLTNHYIGVFNDFFNHIKNNTSNKDLSFLLHKLMLSAY